MTTVLATAGVGHSQTSTGQSTGQKPSGDFYDMGNYDYFAAPPKATPTPPRATPTPTPSPTSPPRASMPSARSAVPSVAPSGPVATLPSAAAAAAAVAPGNMSDAREQAKALAKPARAATAGGLTLTDLSTALPGYTGGTLPQETLFDDPDALVAQGSAAAGASDHYRTATNPDRTVVTVNPTDLARAKAVETDPEAFLQGENLAGGGEACKPLPPTTGGTGYYEATCNEGLKIEQGSRTCNVPLVVTVEGGPPQYEYECDELFDRDRRNGARLCLPFQTHMDSGVCREVARVQIGQTCLQGRWPNCTEPGDPIYELTLQCDSIVTNRPYRVVNNTRVTGERRDEAMCNAATANRTCTLQTETCVDAAPETRMVNGLAVTKACWAWERTYDCYGTETATDCADLAGNRSCTFQREQCLDDPQDGACKVQEKVYRCPIPDGAPVAGPAEYICGGDVYCINGDCEPIEREASTEFKDAMVAVQTMGQANKEFNEATFTLFSGTRETCHRKIFGAANCCSGKGVPLLTPAICNAAEKQLDVKEEKGLCMKVGTYCSDEVFGICVTKKEAHCCFESKLSRILQEQGRPQIGKPWGKPKTEQCKGFTIDEFARLDLSVMDFSEVYAEFMDAAKLPDEVGTTSLIQKKIEEYYDRARP